jgi:hypothetical protein
MVLHPTQRMQLAESHADALRRDGGWRNRTGVGLRSAPSPFEVAIVIRPNRPGDEPALARLAALDSAPIPAAPMLLAEADGELRAALSLHDSVSIADPFHRTAALVELLSARAEQLFAERSGRRRWLSRLRSPVVDRA